MKPDRAALLPGVLRKERVRIALASPLGDKRPGGLGSGRRRTPDAETNNDERAPRGRPDEGRRRARGGCETTEEQFLAADDQLRE